jgi:hypothetical protein
MAVGAKLMGGHYISSKGEFFANGGLRFLASGAALSGLGAPVYGDRRTNLEGALQDIGARRQGLYDSYADLLRQSKDANAAFLQAQHDWKTASKTDKARAKQALDAADAQNKAIHQQTASALGQLTAFDKVNASQSKLIANQRTLAAVYDATVDQLAAARDRVSAQQDVVNGLRQDRLSMANSVSAGIAGFDNGILGHAEQRSSAADIIRGLTYNLQQDKAYGSSLSKLKSMGLSTALLTQLSDGSDDARSRAGILAGSSVADIRTINSLTNQINASAGASGALIAHANFDQQIAAQNKILNANVAAATKLDARLTSLDATLKQVGPYIEKALFGARFQMDPQGVARLVSVGNAQLGRRG